MAKLSTACHVSCGTFHIYRRIKSSPSRVPSRDSIEFESSRIREKTRKLSLQLLRETTRYTYEDLDKISSSRTGSSQDGPSFHRANGRGSHRRAENPENQKSPWTRKSPHNQSYFEILSDRSDEIPTIDAACRVGSRSEQSIDRAETYQSARKLLPNAISSSPSLRRSVRNCSKSCNQRFGRRKIFRSPHNRIH